MPQSMAQLEILRKYLRYGHHEGIAVTLSPEGRINTAPVGIDLADNQVILLLYKGIRTLRNLEETGETALNLTNDSMLYYRSLYFPDRIRFKPSRLVKPPIIDEGVELYVECVVNDYQHMDKRVRFLLKPVEVYLGKGSSLAYSRANYALIEALVYMTKIEALKGVESEEILKRLAEEVIRDLGIVDRLGSDELREASKDLKSRLSRIMGV